MRAYKWYISGFRYYIEKYIFYFSKTKKKKKKKKSVFGRDGGGNSLNHVQTLCPYSSPYTIVHTVKVTYSFVS